MKDDRYVSYQPSVVARLAQIVASLTTSIAALALLDVDLATLVADLAQHVAKLNSKRRIMIVVAEFFGMALSLPPDSLNFVLRR